MKIFIETLITSFGISVILLSDFFFEPILLLTESFALGTCIWIFWIVAGVAVWTLAYIKSIKKTR